MLEEDHCRPLVSTLQPPPKTSLGEVVGANDGHSLCMV